MDWIQLVLGWDLSRFLVNTIMGFLIDEVQGIS